MVRVAELQSMSSTDAMLGYCRLVDEFVPGWRENVQRGEDYSEPSCQAPTETSLHRWGFADTRFEVVATSAGVSSHVRISSDRYPAISRRIKGLWDFFQKKPRVQGPRGQDTCLPELPEPSAELLASLPSAVAAAVFRCRAGTSLGGLRDPWQLRCGGCRRRMPELVMQPRSEEEVISILQKATGDGANNAAFMVIPVGGRTGVSAGCPEMSEDDPRPIVALDMRRMEKVLWIRHEDRLACVEAGITGSSLETLLAREGYTLGMDSGASMDFSTLGGWIASRGLNGKQARYGALEEMLVEVRVATSSGLVWQNGMKDRSCGSVGRRSNGLELPGLLLGSAGCLGVITAAVVRIHPRPERLERDSLRFTTWDQGVSFLRQVAQLPRALKPAACRLLDSTELTLARILREELIADDGDAFGQPSIASAALVVLEGSAEEVAAQRQELTTLANSFRGVWTGADVGEVFHQMNFVVPYLRDLGMDHDLLLDSLQLTLPWSRLQPNLWPCILQAASAEHRRLRLPGALKLWKSLSPLRDGALLRVHVACSVEGLNPAVALNSFESLLRAAEKAVQPERPRSDGGVVSCALRSLKAALDPHHVLGSRSES
eukprot:s215_g9.t1